VACEIVVIALTYDGGLFWWMLADRYVVRDVGELADDVDAAFEELRAAAGSQ
jgi:hypothetical protein